MMLRDRLFHAQEEAAVGQQPPNSFNRAEVSPAKPAPAAQTPAPKAQIMVLIYQQKLKSFVNLQDSFLCNYECF